MIVFLIGILFSHLSWSFSKGMTCFCMYYSRFCRKTEAITHLLTQKDTCMHVHKHICTHISLLEHDSEGWELPHMLSASREAKKDWWCRFLLHSASLNLRGVSASLSLPAGTQSTSSNTIPEQLRNSAQVTTWSSGGSGQWTQKAIYHTLELVSHLCLRMASGSFTYVGFIYVLL